MANHSADSRNIELVTYSSSEESKQPSSLPPPAQVQVPSSSTNSHSAVSTPAPTPYISSPQPLSEGQIDCGTCRLRLKYPSGCLCVQCPACRNITAVQALKKLVCPYCHLASIFPASAELVRCQCGCIYQGNNFPSYS
jgi:LSD1 subclass zinc finger protein